MVWVWILTFLFTIPDKTPLGLLLLCEIEIQYFHEMKVSLKGKVPRNMYDPEMTLSMLQEGGCLPGSEKGFLSNTWKWMVWGGTHADKSETLLEKGAWAESRRVKEPRRTTLPGGSQSQIFIVMGLVSGLSLANHSDAGSFLVTHASLNQDGFQQGGFWEVERHMASPFDLSWTLLVGGGLLVLCSLPGPPGTTIRTNGYRGAWPVWAVSVSVFPLMTVHGFPSLWTCHYRKRNGSAWGGWRLVYPLRYHRVLSVTGEWTLGSEFEPSLWVHSSPLPPFFTPTGNSLSGNIRACDIRNPGAPINAGALFTILCQPRKNSSLVLFKKAWPERELGEFSGRGDWYLSLAPSCFSSWFPFQHNLWYFLAS